MARSPPTSPPSPTSPTSSSLESLSKQDLISLIHTLKDEFLKSRDKVQDLQLLGSPREEEEGFQRDDSIEDDQEESGSERRKRDVERELEGVREREDEWRKEQMRMEEELAGRIEVLDKLRGTVRELEKEKRESTKRYREQADSFDSERQSWYDQEQHYKVRISNLSEERKKKGRLSAGRVRPQEDDSESALEEIKEDTEETGGEERNTPTSTSYLSTTIERELTSSPSPSSTTSDSTPTPNEISLRAQLDSLSTAHTSLTTTLRTLQTEMTDLKRVYQDLQEENESYEILLGEKTLSGEVTGTDFFRKSFSWGEGGNVGSPNGGVQGGWSGFGFQGGLEAVGEGEEDGLESEEEEYSDSSDEEDGEEDIEKILLESKGTGSVNSGAVSAQSPTRKRRSSRRSKSIALAHAKRDSSAGVGLGGGLDLAAELEMAQKEGELDEVEIEKKREKEEKRLRKKEERERKKREARAARRDGSQSMPVGIEDLHLEIKQLREANKALTLYVSKIVDRVCSQEGFEKVLAVDYRNSGNTPKADNSSSSAQPGQPTTLQPDAPVKKARPVSTSFFGRSPNPQKEPSTPKTATSTGLVPTPSSASSVGSTATTSNGPRKSGGLSWDGISSVFGFGSSTPSSNSNNSLSPAAPINQNLSAPGMKPLMLSNEARRLSISDEDEDDILQRERLRVDLSRHGIDYAPTLAQIGRPRSSSTATSPLPTPPSTVTLDPIEQAEKQLQAREREEETIRQQMKEGKGSGLTDAPPRRMQKLERRHSSRGSSISYTISPNSSSIAVAGLGIDSPSPTVTSGSVSPAEGQKGTEIPNEGEQQPGWSKALRRMSKGWTSPPVN
ncbi:hypothetical protein JCM5353_006762 [Sporobolomyces roseus]